MLKEKNFYCFRKSFGTTGLPNLYIPGADGTALLDSSTKLVWQRSGSDGRMSMAHAKEYVAKLNRDRFAGLTTWRLPTLEELMSLMKPRRSSPYYVDSFGRRSWSAVGDPLYIFYEFDSKHDRVWTSDYRSVGRDCAAWCVDFREGTCDGRSGDEFVLFVRAVATGTLVSRSHGERMLRYVINATRAAIVCGDRRAFSAALVAAVTCGTQDRHRCIDYLSEMATDSEYDPYKLLVRQIGEKDWDRRDVVNARGHLSSVDAEYEEALREADYEVFVRRYPELANGE